MAYSAAAVANRADPELVARQDLAAVHRMVHKFGYDDGIWNHLTLKMPGSIDRFLVKPHGLLMSEVCASNLLTVSGDGEVVSGDGYVEQTAFCIHSRIHRIHPGAACILHAHPRYACWLADSEGGYLEIFDQDCLQFDQQVAYDEDYQGIALDVEEGERMARAFGDKSILLSRNHGLTTLGLTVAEAFYRLHYFEHVCTKQYRLAASGNKPCLISDAVRARTRETFPRREPSQAPGLFFTALKRQLDRQHPDYRD